MSTSEDSFAGPAQGRGEARRRAMIEAARELFLERGFEGTSVADVVKVSGGSLATLYASFGSKEGLFEAIVSEISTQIMAPLDAPEMASLALSDALRSFGESFLRLVLCPQHVRFHRMCVAEGPRHPELREALVRNGPGRVNPRMAAFLSSQAAAGRLVIADPSIAATHFFALLKSETHLAALCGGPCELTPGELTGQVRRAVEVFLNGYSPRDVAPATAHVADSTPESSLNPQRPATSGRPRPRRSSR